jgi:hypothetical protein
VAFVGMISVSYGLACMCFDWLPRRWLMAVCQFEDQSQWDDCSFVLTWKGPSALL